MSDIKIFESEQFGQIRTAGDAEHPMFCLADVCKVLEIQQTKDIKARLNNHGVDSIPVWVQTGTKKDGTPAMRETSMTFINEQNLYKVIMRSDKPQAEPFQDWVCGEVLPAIRKTGGYIHSDGLSDDEIMAKALDIAHKTIERKNLENQRLRQGLNELEEENKRIENDNKRLEGENLQLAVENQELHHDKSYLDLIMRSKKLMTVSQIAQDYGMSGRAMNMMLADMKIQYSINGQWILYSQYKNCGYVSSRSIEITRSDGQPDIVLHTEWTQAGRKFLYEELKKRGTIPMLEQ